MSLHVQLDAWRPRLAIKAPALPILERAQAAGEGVA